MNLLTILLLLIINLNQIFGSEIVVTTKNGQIKGHQVFNSKQLVNEFIGIRYAKPPIGELRFKKPQPEGNWTGVYNATLRRNVCMQNNIYGEIPKLYGSEMGEDCLFLNVWTTNTSASQPVFVWIHGGGLVAGAGLEKRKNGTALASHHVTVVSLEYRLGPFGFLYGGNQDAPGNVGFYDQLMALTWVKENIKSFGGDPNQVTIGGESAGGFSVGYHLISDLSKDLFKRAIIQSGAPYKDSLFSTTNSQFLKASKQFAEHIGCKGENWIKCLKQLDAKELLKSDSISINKIINDEFYKQTAKEALRSGKFHSNTQIIAGTTHNEGDSFVGWFISDEKIVTKNELKKYIKRDFQKYNTDSIYQFYIAKQNESDQNSLKKSFGSIYGDSKLLCPTYFFAQDFANWSSNNSVYFYDFDQKLTKKSKNDSCSAKWMGVCHAEDVPIVFGQAVLNENEFQSEDVNFSEMIMTLWTNFIKNGDPVRNLNNITWPAIQKEQYWVKHLSFERGNFTNELNPYKERCDKFWRPYF